MEKKSARPGRRDTANRRVTIKDIAREVDMSFTSVSRILRGDSLFSEDTIRRVKEKAREMKYRPNIMARALVKSGNSLVGLVLREIEYSFNAAIIAGAQEELEERGYSILLCNSNMDEGDEHKHLNILLDKSVEGVIITPISTSPVNSDIYSDLVANNVPFTMVGIRKAGIPAASVTVDNVEGGRIAARHLLGLGHRECLYITPSVDEINRHTQIDRSENTDRFEGFREVVLSAASSGAGCSLIEAQRSRVTDETIERILSLPRRPTGIFCYSDMIAIQTMRLLQRRKFDIPRDFSIIGYDDLDIAALVLPGLTTIGQPKKDMGRLAAVKLLGMLESHTQSQEHTLLHPELIVRESTAVAPGR